MSHHRLYREFLTALQQRYPSNVTCLITDNGASVNHQFPDGRFPLHIAAERQDLGTVQALLSLRASPDLKNKAGESALLVCIRCIESSERAVEIVNALINRGANVNSFDSQKRTALHLAAAKGRPSLVLTLLGNRARVDSLDAWSRTPLHLALLNMGQHRPPSNNYIEVISMLLSHKSDVNRRDRYQATPLFLAVNHGDACAEVVYALLARGARVDRTSRHALTPVMLAVLKGHLNLVRILVGHNANLSHRFSNTGRSCLFTALLRGYEEIAGLIVAGGCALHEELWLFDDVITCTQILRKCPHLQGFIEELTSAPQSLKALSRAVIRRQHGPGLRCYMDRLHYPSALKSFVLLEEETRTDNESFTYL